MTGRAPRTRRVPRTGLPRALARCRAACALLLAATVPAQVVPPQPAPQPAPNPAQGQGQEQGPQPPGPQQGERPQGADLLTDPRAQALYGRTIRRILVFKRSRNTLTPMPEQTTDSIVRSLLSRVGQPLELRKLTTDVGNLWYDQRFAVIATGRADGDQVELVLIVAQELEYYERVEFQGLRQFQRTEIDALLGLYPDRQVTSTEALAMRNILIARYHRDGFAFVAIDPQERELAQGEGSGERPRKIVTFRIDEGPKVTVGTLSFRGNASFPAEKSTLISPGDFLVRESHMLHTPAWFISSGAAYSREILEEDLDRLQLFYRSRGFLDAIVTVTDVHLRPDNSTVDLSFLVVEGQRYTIRSVRIVHVDNSGHEVPASKVRYSADEIRKEMKIAVGDFYDHIQIRRDMQAIEDFYGHRGHPKSSFPGMDRVPGAFSVLPPRERYDEQAGVELTFEIVEGTPKTLRDIVIRGNTATRDEVIRRKVYALPGERVDMQKVQKSIRYLDATRFFQDPLTLAGPHFEMSQVSGHDDLVDLGIDVTEGETGEFRWGVGITSGAGAMATFEFNKRNFDLFSPPSTWDPFKAIGEILENRAFHGGGQTLNLMLAPGTQVSQGSIIYTHPDLFGEHYETTELQVKGRRLLVFRDGYRRDSLGLELGLFRNLSEQWSAGVTFREESIEINDLEPDATSLAFAAEGQTEARGARARTTYKYYDDPRRPTDGYELTASYELLGGMFGAEIDMWKAIASTNFYIPIAENVLGHRTVLHLEQQFGLAEAIQGSDDVFITERFYLGGSQSLRGFDFRGVGPSQFGRPFGGEATWYGTAEIGFPLVPTRLERELRDRELLRGVAFVDFGFLGLGLNDATFHQMRLSYGIGLRIDVPVLDIPIALDLGWPILYEETDRRRAFLFSISRQ